MESNHHGFAVVWVSKPVIAIDTTFLKEEYRGFEPLNAGAFLR